MFKSNRFLSREQEEEIIKSIRSAEEKTSGEIRVHIQKKLKGPLMDHAAKVFRELKMDQTDARNGVLIFIVPSSRQFCLLGDSGIDRVVPENFWEDIKDDLSLHFRENRMAEGLIVNIRRIGEKLKAHFPIKTDDKNELPDTISFS